MNERVSFSKIGAIAIQQRTSWCFGVPPFDAEGCDDLGRRA